ncbi:unnamed protein product [Blepharisma stoltei]|uniref:Signal peptide peptidase n=1 Tax=Blepharisma stoltei TaxID=1481888 RepID=A0AAU9JVQ2_9CILI|nr:unnamed protein product [Blepharisma stoltei]
MSKSFLIGFGLLAIVTTILQFCPLPISFNLLCFSLVPIYIGSMRSRKLSPFYHGSNEEEQEIEPLDAAEALRFPLVAAAVLVGLYVCIKYINPELVNFLLSIYFLIIGIYCLKSYIYIYFKNVKYCESTFKWTKTICIPYFVPKPEILEVTKQDIISYLIATPVGLLYIFTKNWVLNNVFGIAFTIHAIENMPLGSFKVGYGLLAGLIVYDVFFVFGTDIMITVAKSIDGPIKLLFPKATGDFSMIGLGDIILPGIFIALALRYDLFRENKKEMKEQKLYFFTTVAGYAIGILMTNLAMVLMEKEQPALLYLVPMCLLSTGVMALIKKEIPMLWKYKEGE